MDFRNILKSLGHISEATEKTKTGVKNTAKISEGKTPKDKEVSVGKKNSLKEHFDQISQSTNENFINSTTQAVVTETDYSNLENEYYYVINSQTGEVVDGPFDNAGEVPLRLMGFDGGHKVKTGAELKGLDEEVMTNIAEIKANPKYLHAAERSRKDAQDTQRQYWRSPEDKAAARRTEIKRDKGLLGYSKRYNKEHPRPEVKASPAPKYRDSSIDYSDDYSTWAAGRRDTMEQDGSDNKKIEAYGVYGMKSKPWRKTFKNQAALEAWLEKNEGNVEIHGTRELEQSVEEAEQIQIKPASQVPQQPGQTSQPGQQQQVQGQQQKNTQVIQQGNKTLGTVDNPQLAQQIKQSIGKGEMTLMPDDEQNMTEGSLNEFGGGGYPSTPKYKVGDSVLVKGYQGVGKIAYIKHRGDVGVVINEPTNQRVVTTIDDLVLKKGVAEGKDEGKPGKNFAKIAKSAAKEYGSKAAGERVAGAVRAKLMKQGKIEESIRLSESSDTLEHIINKFKHEVKNFVNGDDLDSDLYEALFDYYSDAGEIPYGIAKGRTGDPFEWVTQRFDRDVQDHVVDESGPARVDVPAYKRINRDFPVRDLPIGNTKTLQGGIKAPIKQPAKIDPFAMGESDMMDMQFESWDRQLNKLLTEGITVSSSKGQQGAPDSVSVTATDADSDHLLAALRNAGLGIFGDNQQQQGFGTGMTMHSVGGESPMGNGAEPEQSPDVVGDGDDMLSLIKKMSGIQDSGNPEGTVEVDYEEENDDDRDQDIEEDYEENGEEDEVDEGNAFSGAVAKAKSDNIPDKGQKFKVGGKSYPVKEEEIDEGDEEECNECGYAMEACECDHEQVDENYANSAEDPAETEMMKLKALLTVGGDMHRLKRNQTVGNPTQVAFESQVNDWKKLSGIK